MREPYCKTDEQPRHISSIFSEESVERLMAISDEIQTELTNIKICPAPCKDGTIRVSPSSGTSRRCRCPILSHYCVYGSGLEEKLEARLRKLMLETGVPCRHIDNFDAYFESLPFIWANKWNFQGFLVLSGGSGVGKSFAAAWAVKEYLRSKIPDLLDVVTWSKATTAGDSMMWRSANRMIHDRNTISAAWSKPFLVIDDLGKEGDSPTRQADVSNIISARYDAKLPTIVTTELAFTDIISAYGKHTAYKLSEDENSDSGGMIINCGNISVRYEDDWETGNGEDVL
ncbi:hypothetical protein AGMMS49957_00040 [Synergistales bacterium]|nr:hypothetical protein AGMMS49957_00040 [Synergistales bacterium]